MNRTDMAVEFTAETARKDVQLKKEIRNGIRSTVVTVGNNASKLLGKPCGRYITVHYGTNDDKGAAARTIAGYVGDFLPHTARWERIIVAGLGNSNITPDSLGTATARKIPASAHMAATKEFMELGMRPVIVTETGVLAKTGVESAEQLRYLCENCHPAAVIVVDSLACGEYDRLLSSVQITDTGIAPGSGVSNSRAEISSQTLGAKVIAIGVPTVIDAEGGDKRAAPGLMVTPRNIDAMIKLYSDIISSALYKVLYPGLSPEEVAALLF